MWFPSDCHETFLSLSHSKMCRLYTLCIYEFSSFSTYVVLPSALNMIIYQIDQYPSILLINFLPFSFSYFSRRKNTNLKISSFLPLSLSQTIWSFFLLFSLQSLPLRVCALTSFLRIYGWISAFLGGLKLIKTSKNKLSIGRTYNCNDEEDLREYP